MTRSDGAAVPDDHVIVLFGALGDLSKRKLLPGLFHLDRAGLMPERYKVIGTSRKGGTADEFRAVARKAVGDAAGETWEGFAQRLEFSAFSADQPEPLTEAVGRAESEMGSEPRRLHYLSIPPGAFGATVDALGSTSLHERSRVVLEKPFGYDLDSARELNTLVHGVFPEERVFRIDHFLGREAVQNLIALRFANGMFEPIWNRDHIDHVQIDVPETLAVDDRAGFYEDTGAYRDMVVTHLFHVLGFVAMEPPTTLGGAVDRRGDREGVPLGLPHRPGERDPRPVRRLPRGRGRRPATRRPRRSSRCAPGSTTGAGPACRSSCVPASGWASSGGC